MKKTIIYHPYKKDSSYLREALYKVYGHKCAYCSRNLELRYMHVDHILPTNRAETDGETKQYIQELVKDGFIQDSIENYFPVCPTCNLEKSNWTFSASNLRFFHELARKHLDKVLSGIEQLKRNHSEFFYEPVDLSIWEELTFKDQRDLSHAIMGYSLTSMDVECCPIFPQVSRTEKQLCIVDYVVIQGETGCGKSICLYQVAHRFFQNGWSVYLLRNSFTEGMLILPNNTEKSLYIIDDAQTLQDSLLDHITRQGRNNRKVLLAKTITDRTNSDTIILTQKDAVNILYREFLNRKEEIWPIVKRYDNTIGVNIFDLPIEKRLADARNAVTPWQFSYILRGGWKTMEELYKSIGDRNDCDLLAAVIATFQILQLDKAVDLDQLGERLRAIAPEYRWGASDLELLIDRRIVLSKDDIRIVHLESACIIVTLFFDAPPNEKQDLLLKVIEKSLLSEEISPLGIVWLCNGCNRYIKHIWRIEDKFLTDRIIENVSVQLYKPHTSEEVRNTMYLLQKILASKEKDKGIQILFDNSNQIIHLIDHADSISAWGFSELLNSLYNYDHKKHNSISSCISWTKLMKHMMQEHDPDYYAWGKLFNRGILLLGKKRYSVYKDDMHEVLEWVASKASVNNIEGITGFISSVAFLDHTQIPAIISSIIPVYKQFFENNTERAIHLVNFDFMFEICDMDPFNGKKSKIERMNDTAKQFVDIMPDKKLASVISNSNGQEWLAIRDILYFIYWFDKEKYMDIAKGINLEQLSDKVKYSWDQSYEISLIFEFLVISDISIAKHFLAMNEERVSAYYPMMVIADPISAIKANREKNVKIDLFATHQWNDTLSALKALYKEDRQFCIDYLRNNSSLISEKYSNVSDFDFSKREALGLLKEIQKIDEKTYSDIIAGINRDKILEKMDKCIGISPRKNQWVKRRKREFYEILGLASETEAEECKV